MNQLNDAEAGNVGNIVPDQGDVGAIGGEPLSPPPSTSCCGETRSCQCKHCE